MKKVLVSTIAASAFLASGAVFAGSEATTDPFTQSVINSVGKGSAVESLSTTFDVEVKKDDALENFGWNEFEAN